MTNVQVSGKTELLTSIIENRTRQQTRAEAPSRVPMSTILQAQEFERSLQAGGSYYWFETRLQGYDDLNPYWTHDEQHSRF
jgi:hypothetical protein